MSVWRYRAVAAGGRVESGQLGGDSAAAVRASLRRIGLTVIDVRPAHRRSGERVRVVQPVLDLAAAHLRRRRTEARSELFDAISTMLDAGLPLLEAVETALASSGLRARASLRSMLTALRESLRGGSSLSEAMAAHRTWFDAAECAMVEAGQHRGELAGVLRSLSERHRRRSELGQRLAGVLVYPAVVAVVGVGVVIFLSTRTLPDLVSILESARIETPRLTRIVMAIGRWLAAAWPVVLVAGALLGAATSIALAKSAARGVEWPPAVRRCVPRVARRLALSRLAGELADMTRAGVPMVEALRVLARTFASPVTASLGRRLFGAADAIEQGTSIEEALADPLWFDAELKRLVSAGQASGELPEMLERLAGREQRRAARLVERLVSLLEPAVILLLAMLVGVVAMAAVQPLLRMQEMF